MRPLAWLLLLLGAALLPVLPAAAMPPPLELSGQGPVAAGPALETLRDPAGKLTAPQVLHHPDFALAASPEPTFGLTPDAVWTRFSVRRGPEETGDWYLVLRHGMLDQATLHRLRADGAFDSVAAGSEMPPAARPLNHRHIVFPVSLPANETVIFLLRAQTHGSVQFPLEFITPAALAARDYREQLAFGIAFGIAFALGMYGLLVSGVLRESTYLWFGLTVTGYLVYQSNQYGFLRQLSPGGEAMPIQYISATSATLALYFFTRFFSHYFNLAGRTPRLWRLISGISLLILLALPVSAVAGPQPAHMMNLVAAIVVMTASVVLVVRLFPSQPRAAAFYLAGWAMYLIGLPVFMLRLFGVPVPLIETATVHAGGFALGSVFWAAAITERLRAQHAAQSAALLRSEANLERQVALQTLELRNRNQELARAVNELANAKMAAEEANQARGDFLAHMSHELRTPLNAIIGFAEMIERRMFGNATMDRYAEYGTDIRRSGEHLLNLVNDVLDLSRIDAGRMDIFPEPVSLQQQVEQCIGMTRGNAELAGVSLTFELREPLPPVQADPRAVRQILLNLLSNAVKFTPEGGRIVVEVGRASPGEQYVRVCDSGIGISPEALATVFEPFRRGDARTSRDKPGTGLGLAISRHLARLHDGTLDLASEPGRGTTATLRLPDAGPAAARGRSA
jgi:signal transduction histidine kinase